MTEEQKRIERLLIGKWNLEVMKLGVKVKEAYIRYEYNLEHEVYFGNVIHEARVIGSETLPYTLRHTGHQTFIVTGTFAKEICAISEFYLLLKIGESFWILKKAV